MALFDFLIDLTPILKRIEQMEAKVMATAAEVKEKLARLTTEVSESVEAISALRADVQALKDQIGNAEALQAAIDEIDTALGGLSDKLDAAQNPPAPEPTPETASNN